MESELGSWLDLPSETEHLEFKAAKSSYKDKDVHRYCAALANEGGGHLVLGVTDEAPRMVVGTKAFEGKALQGLRNSLRDRVSAHVRVWEIAYNSKRVLVFEVTSRATGSAVELDGAYWMRSGESLVPMPPDRLKEILLEDSADALDEPASQPMEATEVIAALDTQSFFDLIGQPYPTNRNAVLERLASEGLIDPAGRAKWRITGLGAVAIAKHRGSVSKPLERRATRVVLYEGTSKMVTRSERTFSGGIAPEFEELVEFVYSSAPRNRLLEEAIRRETQMFPKQAIRELVANALIHQDFSHRGARVMIELYEDRLEVSNPGVPSIKPDRFIDEYNSRNEALADLMRRFGICEEKGSGIDKVVFAAEAHQLPPPDFRAGSLRTTSVLYAHRGFKLMSKAERIRACYQHCVLKYVTGGRMSNESLRRRLGLKDKQAGLASQIITATKEDGLIQLEPSDSSSTRYARYLPYWA